MWVTNYHFFVSFFFDTFTDINKKTNKTKNHREMHELDRWTSFQMDGYRQLKNPPYQ